MSPGQPPVVTGIPYGPTPVSLTCFRYGVVVMDDYRLYGLPSKTLFIFVMDDCNDTSSVMLITMDYPGIVIERITGAPDPEVRGATIIPSVYRLSQPQKRLSPPEVQPQGGRL